MKKKLFLYALIAFIALLVIMFVYRFYFEFKNAEVKKRLKDEAAKYGSNSDAVYKILHESVESILRNASQTAMVRTYAKANGLPKEQVLVDAAIVQAQNLKYIG